MTKRAASFFSLLLLLDWETSLQKLSQPANGLSRAYRITTTAWRPPHHTTATPKNAVMVTADARFAKGPKKAIIGQIFDLLLASPPLLLT